MDGASVDARGGPARRDELFLRMDGCVRAQPNQSRRRIRRIFLNPTNHAAISAEYSSIRPITPSYPQNIPQPDRSRRHIRRILPNPTNHAVVSAEYSPTRPITPPYPQNIPQPNRSRRHIRRIFPTPTNHTAISAEYSSIRPITPPYPQNIPQPDQSRRHIRRIFLNPTNHAAISALRGPTLYALPAARRAYLVDRSCLCTTMAAFVWDCLPPVVWYNSGNNSDCYSVSRPFFILSNRMSPRHLIENVAKEIEVETTRVGPLIPETTPINLVPGRRAPAQFV
eukprot:1195171-Prorocentrum_minimum.AAC.1